MAEQFTTSHIAEFPSKDDLVFGLDIGTRNVVGTVGFRDEDGFHVVAMSIREHKTRAMLDGQIHNIAHVAEVIAEVKEELEASLGFHLEQVCIAAAGRVLVTETTKVSYEYPEESVVTEEDLHTLDLLGIDQAQQILNQRADNQYRFYCVGYSVMHYYLNGELFGSLEGHKAEEIAEDIIVTFLPEDVVDGLYSAVERAGLEVANLTLEPIAAINVAIPENFRMLNIALVDVGAGTSDLCVTKDGSIVAYGMIPYAGDELTEVLVQAFLVDFATAEKIKKESTELAEITYNDIMGIAHTIPAEEVWKLTDPVVEKITDAVAKRIIELNGDHSVAACFVVGGGGKIHGFCERLAEKLEILKERVALRGEEVMGNIIFENQSIAKDPLLVTPIGICLNFYDQKNNFIMIHFNGEMMKLYDNGRLTVVDAALQAGYQTEDLFPRRGAEIHFTVNGVSRMIRGQEGESSYVVMNGVQVGLQAPLERNAEITITPSTAGDIARSTLEELDEFQSDRVSFVVNGKVVVCPKFVEVNGSLEPGYYEIQEGDAIETRNYYTVGQLARFMDVELDPDGEIMVNNRIASLDTLIYENFSIDWVTLDYASTDASYTDGNPEETFAGPASDDSSADEDNTSHLEGEEDFLYEKEDSLSADWSLEEEAEGENRGAENGDDGNHDSVSGDTPIAINVTINHDPHVLRGKASYMFIDIFNVIDFDTNQSHGRGVYTTINGNPCGYMDAIKDGDVIEIGWVEK
ncbi:MAG: cell division FtsA domain-containing protein [Lachnospiraceae bacterium]|nr:cell division FtsA domain-containing protein [Lachnospiraceae bacterium]MEE3432522.1 cell division FtsA domain-containing protein [Lachnospiraceae bacterium]